jgi:hypothetical protein
VKKNVQGWLILLGLVGFFWFVFTYNHSPPLRPLPDPQDARSGRVEGYNWALANSISEPKECDNLYGKSSDFVRGCHAYVISKEMNKPYAPEDDRDLNQDQDPE